MLFGGVGNDYLFGGTGDDILVGDGNSNVLTGGAGNNILIAGGGAGTLTGGKGANILIGGKTSDDLNPSALDAILAEWSRTDVTYAVKVQHILNGGGKNGTTTLNASNVKSNGGVNVLTGSGTQNLFFGSKSRDQTNAKPTDTFVSV